MVYNPQDGVSYLSLRSNSGFRSYDYYMASLSLVYLKSFIP